MPYSAGDTQARIDARTSTASGNYDWALSWAFGNVANLNDLIDDIEGEIPASGGLTSWVSSDTFFTEITVEDLTGVNATQQRTINEQGAAGAPPVSPQVALVHTLRTAAAGRSFRGRFYLGGIAASFLGTGNASWTSGGTPTAQQVADAVFAGFTVMGGSGGIWSVNSRKLEVLTPIQQVVARTQYLGTQRRRAELD